MAYILIHTSSRQIPIQNQALRLQSELQTIGHTVEFSTETHPLRLFKNNYDVFHILCDKSYLRFSEISLTVWAKLNGLATVVSQFHANTTSPSMGGPQRFQFPHIDALSTTHLESLKIHKFKYKNKFILPLFPNEIKSQGHDKINKISILKIITQNFDELSSSIVPDYIDASALALNNKASDIRKKWKKFQAQNSKFKKVVLILESENTIELMQTEKLIIDLKSVFNPVHFQSLVDQICAFKSFGILNKNQASGYSEFWLHQKNCWISDLQNSKTKELKNIMTCAEVFFNSKTDDLMKISIENKINEISRLYSKIINSKALTYHQNKVPSV